MLPSAQTLHDFQLLQKDVSLFLFLVVVKQSRQTMVLSFQAYLNLKIWSRRLFTIHIYITLCEKGTDERYNGITRRFIPKCKCINDFAPDYIAGIEIWYNSLPRKILNYRTLGEVFEDELDHIYRQSAS